MAPLLRLLGAIHGKRVHSRRTRVLAAHFSEMIPGGHRVLDIGCGDGLIDRLVLEGRPDLSLVGVDPLVRKNAHIEVLPMQDDRLPFDGASWDTVLLSDVLHHSERPLALLGEAVRVARHNVLVKDHTAQGILSRQTLRLMDLVGNAPHGVASVFNYLSPSEWRDAFRVVGLAPRQVRSRLGLYPWWAEPFFGRSLHFVSLCDVIGRAA